jgi:hypothetical protein
LFFRRGFGRLKVAHGPGDVDVGFEADTAIPIEPYQEQRAVARIFSCDKQAKTTTECC